MLLNGKVVTELKESDLQELIARGETELKTREYKRELPGTGEQAVKEFLADVCSFANSAGGFLIYGIAADGDRPVALSGLSPSVPNDAILRLEACTRDGIEPRIPGIHSQAVGLADDNWVLVMEIPKSWAAPHMVKFKNASRFYGRNSRGKFQLDVQEIRAAFLASETLSDKLRAFRFDRLAKIKAGDTPGPLLERAKYVLQVAPIAAFGGQTAVDVKAAYRAIHEGQLLFLGDSFVRYNFDGVLAYQIGDITERKATWQAYTQLFRSGTVEVVDTYALHSQGTQDPLIHCLALEKRIISLCHRCLVYQRQAGIEPPVVIFLSFLCVLGYRLPTTHVGKSSLTASGPIDRDVLLLPEVWFDEYPQNMAAVVDWLKPAFDALWNAVGFPEWLLYQKHREWAEAQSAG